MLECLEQKAYSFAENAHSAINHRRKYTNEPYFTHCYRVASMVFSVKEELKTPQETIAAAFLHDTVEDTDVSLEDIRSEFGSVVCYYVDCLTERDKSEFPNWNRRLRKKFYAECLSSSPSDVQTIKCADIIDNVPSIVMFDPNFAKVYIEEKIEMLSGMDRSNESLRSKALDIIRQSA